MGKPRKPKKALRRLVQVDNDGAVERNRTFTGCPTATSTLRVYHFRHDRIFLVSRRKFTCKQDALRQGGDAGTDVM